MAKAKTKKSKAVSVRIPDLEEEFGLEGRIIRQVIRGLGMNAPKLTDSEGFGPKSRYEWTEGSADLKKIRKALKEAKANREANPPKERKKKSKKAKVVEVDEDEDEEDEDDDEDDDVPEDDDDDDDDEDDD